MYSTVQCSLAIIRKQNEQGTQKSEARRRREQTSDLDWIDFSCFVLRTEHAICLTLSLPCIQRKVRGGRSQMKRYGTPRTHIHTHAHLSQWKNRQYLHLLYFCSNILNNQTARYVVCGVRTAPSAPITQKFVYLLHFVIYHYLIAKFDK